MSRHRAVRNLDIEEVLEEDDYADEYDENELDEGDLSQEDRTNLAEGLAHVHSVVGDNIPVSDTEIKEALWYYYFDREETVNWVVEQIAQRKAEEEKQKKKAAKKAAKDRQPKYRRPPSTLYPMVLWKREQQQALESQTKPKPTSLAQLSQRSHPRTSALQSLANRNTPTKSDSEDGKTKPSLLGLAKKNNEAKKSTGVGPSSSLQSLAQKATGQRGQTALQSLASRQTSRPLSSSSTTTEPPKTSLTALAKLAKKEDASAQRTRLSHLATRTTTTTTTAPSPSTNNKLSGLAGLAKKQNVASTTPEYKKKDEKPISSNVKEQPKIQEEIPRQQQSLPSEQSQQPKILIPLSTNPLCAPPSAAATFLFKNPGKGGRGHTDTTANSLLASIPDSVGKAFYEAIKTSADNIHVFTFNVPSPDDIGLEAQSHRSGGRK